jgi:hypothetical protein
MNSSPVKFSAAAVVLAALALAGCGSSGGAVSVPTVQAARIFALSGFAPAAPVRPGRPVTVTFTVDMPNGKPLTKYKTGTGPHTGVHLIIVRDDLAYIIHTHPPIGPNGLLRQTVTFPAPGSYHVLVDLYPNLPGVIPNFQLTQKIDVTGGYHPIKLPPFKSDLVVDGYHFDMRGQAPPKLQAIQPEFLHVDVTDPHGHNVTFTPWFGALAHAIFFREGTLDYFHTHICAPSAPNCGTLPGVAATRITGTAPAPGKLTVGVLLAVPGAWRLFLQMKLGGKIVTAPYTLKVT